MFPAIFFLRVIRMRRREKSKSFDLKTFLEGVSLFSGLADEDLEAVAGNAVVRTFPKNAVLIFEGDRTTSLHVVLKGAALAVSIDEEGRQIVHDEFKEGDIFGEMSFLDGNPRCATVMTKTATTVAIFERENIEALLCAHPQLSLRIIRGLLQKLRIATRRIEDLVFLDAYGRVSQLLIRLADGKKSIDDRLTHQEIAERVGLSREMVSRVLKELSDSGYISRKNKIIAIQKKLPSSW